LERIEFIGWRRLLAACALVGSMVLCLVSADHLYYRHDQTWNEFRAYNGLRGQIHGTPLTNSIPQVASCVGWSRNDGELFRRFYYAEPEVYASTSKMRVLLSQLEAGYHVEPAAFHKQLMKCAFLPNGLPRDSGFLMKLALLNAVLCLLFAGIYLRRYALTLFASYGLFVILSVYLRTTARLPERVAFTMPLFMNLMCLYWSACARCSTLPIGGALAVSKFLPTLTRPRIRTWARRASLVACAGLYIPCLFHFSEGWWYGNVFNSKVRAVSRTIFQPVSTLLPPGQTPVLVPMPSDSMLEACLAYVGLSAKPPFSVVPYGWPTHSPIFQQVLDQHQLHPFSLSLLDRPDVVLLMNDTWPAQLKTFYWEHYGKEIRFELAVNTDAFPEYGANGLHLYRAFSSPDKPTPGNELSQPARSSQSGAALSREEMAAVAVQGQRNSH